MPRGGQLPRRGALPHHAWCALLSGLGRLDLQLPWGHADDRGGVCPGPVASGAAVAVVVQTRRRTAEPCRCGFLSARGAFGAFTTPELCWFRRCGCYAARAGAWGCVWYGAWTASLKQPQAAWELLHGGFEADQKESLPCGLGFCVSACKAHCWLAAWSRGARGGGDATGVHYYVTMMPRLGWLGDHTGRRVGMYIGIERSFALEL